MFQFYSLTLNDSTTSNTLTVTVNLEDVTADIITEVLKSLSTWSE